MKKGVSVFAAVFLLSVNSFAAENLNENADEKITVLTVEDAVNHALKNSYTLKSADIDLAMTERAAKYSWNVLLPTLSVTGTMVRSTEYSPSSAAMSQMMSGILGSPAVTDFENESDRWAVVGGLSAGWNFSFAYIEQIRAAKASYEAGKITFEQSQTETVVNVKKLFYGLLIQQENLKIQKESLENARQRAIQAEMNFKNGLVPEIQMLQTQVNYQNAKPSVETAEQTINQQLDTFAFLLGMPVGTKISLSGEIEPVYIEVNADELLEKYSENSPDIKSLRKNLDILKMNLNAVNLASYIPAISVNYGWSPAYTGSFPDFYKDIGKDDMWYDSGSLSFTLAWNLMNMLPFSANRQTARDLKDNIAKLELSLEMLKENQKLEVYKNVDNLNQTRQQIEAMGRTVEVAERAYKMSENSYRNGTTELLDLRDAENSLNQAKLGQLNEKMNYINALMDLESILNISLTDGGTK